MLSIGQHAARAAKKEVFNMNKKILLAILAIALVFGITACDDGGGPSSGGGGGGSSGGGVWTASSFGGAINVAYGNGKFVTVGTGIAYSSDGINWKTAASPSSYYRIEEIAFGNGKFVVGTQDGCISTSTDGVTWTATKSIYSSSFSSVDGLAFGNGIFVAGGGYYMDSIRTSTDGVTWTPSKEISGLSINTIAYGNGKFVAGGGGGKFGVSSDGSTWTTASHNIITKTKWSDSPSSIMSIAYGNGKFVAGTGDGKIAYSSDGLTWTTVANSPFDEYPYIFGDANYDTMEALLYCINAIAFGDGKFVAACLGGRTAVSSDGSTWRVVSESAFGKDMSLANGINAITYGNGKFVAVGGGIGYWNGK
jgi:hypothetical protein